MSESSEEEREEEQSTVLPTPLRRSVSVGGQENDGRTSVLRALCSTRKSRRKLKRGLPPSMAMRMMKMKKMMKMMKMTKMEVKKMKVQTKGTG
ncbi:hypothetical protein PF007_g13704 [Phytophthora fragariae]|uniref:Uncharacterized protein n=1 Tax=Phytophthora fragariae TaxID=53985 RepID=A0A6A3TDE9_9STRA|nr:hypothetical protein PF009_g13859 [Phytophthora fragariae]KAE9105419.1 hypothetical protein PF007_g13704 [Phytophthora fragariae]KAE9133917.1 hypothetical protein PF006_g14940 [Phytophthora fragariae]